jgi:hypothetical protein
MHLISRCLNHDVPNSEAVCSLTVLLLLGPNFLKILTSLFVSKMKVSCASFWFLYF